MPRELFEEYKDAMEDNGRNEATSIFYFKHFLNEEAALWFKLQVKPKIRKNFTWNDFEKHSEANYLGREEKERVSLFLKELRMKQDDRVANFIRKIQQYLLILNPDITEIEMIQSIQKKLRLEYASAIIDAEPNPIIELRDACRKVEAKIDLRRAAIARNGFNPRKNVSIKSKTKTVSCCAFRRDVSQRFYYLAMTYL